MPARVLVLVLGFAATAVGAEWSGVIEIEESISGPAASGSDREELEELSQTLKERIARARTELAEAPPTVARVLREDIGAYTAELERLVAVRGGALPIGTTTYRIRGQRLLAIGAEGRVLVDRDAGTAQVLAGGRRADAVLAARPEPMTGSEAGPVYEGVPTRSFSFRTSAGPCVAWVRGDLPNPYAMALLERAGDDATADELTARLAALPGLPVQVEVTIGPVVRRRTARPPVARPVADAELALK